MRNPLPDEAQEILRAATQVQGNRVQQVAAIEAAIKEVTTRWPEFFNIANGGDEHGYESE